VVVTREAGIGVVRLNRPGARNAVTAEMAQSAGTAVDEMSRDPDVRAIVVTGTGDVAFSAGADLKEFAAGVLPYAARMEWGFAGLTEQVVSKPVIAAVNGFALGGGLEIMLWADVAVASETATFGLPEVRVGVIAGAGGLIRLPRQIPERIALGMALTGDPISASDAQRHGLVNELAAPDEVLPRAMAIASKVAANAPLAVEASKRIIRGIVDGESADEAAAWELNNLEMTAIRASEDAREGPRAFAEKRPPVWRRR
jgi:crotonobetainyl-CoA hydratase